MDVFLVKSMETIGQLDLRGMIGTIYNGDYQTLLHTKYKSSGPCGFREEEILVFRIVSQWTLSTPGAWPNLTLGAWLARFI